jgi:hypothetical protein
LSRSQIAQLSIILCFYMCASLWTLLRLPIVTNEFGEQGVRVGDATLRLEDYRAIKLTALVMNLAVLNLLGVSISYALLAGKRWKANWSNYKREGQLAIETFSRPDSTTSSLVSQLPRIPHEPPTVYIEEDDEPLEAWHRNVGGTPSCLKSGRDDAKELVMAAIIQVLSIHGPKGAYVGYCYHDLHRVRRANDQQKRVLKTQKPSENVTIAYRIDGSMNRAHCVAFFNVMVSASKVEIFWSTSTLWMSAKDSFLYNWKWLLLSCATAIFSVSCFSFATPILLLYIFLKLPPTRGVTPILARITRDRNSGQFSGDHPSREDERLMKSFRQDVHSLLKHYLQYTLELYH